MSYGAEFLSEYAYEIDQAQREDVCGVCKWNRRLGSGFGCGNARSDYYTDYTEYTDTCPMFQERGVDK